ncbi:MAG: hypothetical protein ACWGHO_04135 [Candidatus Moraniibacteriota bacterium]
MRKYINIKKINIFLRSKKSNFFVLCAMIVAAVGGSIMTTYAEQFIDSFLDTSRVANTWNVEVDTANGEVKLAQRACDNTVWFCDMTWRCAGTAGDGNGLLVKRTDESGKQWKIWNNACDTPECGIDGGQTDNLVVDNTLDFSAFYPAREACKAVGGRLPTVDEMRCMFTYKASFGNNLASSYYWTSEEYSASEAKGIYYYNAQIVNLTKTDVRYTRCVRGW